MRVVAVAFALLLGCSHSAEDGATITFPDPAAGDRLVDGVWLGSRSYSGPLSVTLRPLTDGRDWPCERTTWDVHGRAAPWDMGHVVDGQIDLRATGCDEPIRLPYVFAVETP